MNEKQQRFCEEYIIDHNATQAAIRAGYKERSAYSQAFDLLRKPEIQAKIQELSRKITTANVASAEEVLEYFTRTMRGETFDQVVKRSEDGSLQRIDVAARLTDRTRAAEALAKHYALLVEKVELTKPKSDLADEIEAMLRGR